MNQNDTWDLSLGKEISRPGAPYPPASSERKIYVYTRNCAQSCLERLRGGNLPLKSQSDQIYV